jgi:uncharacterized protein
VVAGPDADPGRQALAQAGRAVPDPNRIVLEVSPETELPENHPAAGKGMLDGQSAAYVCVGETC